MAPDAFAPLLLALAVVLALDREPDEQVRQHDQDGHAEQRDARADGGIPADHDQDHAGDGDREWEADSYEGQHGP